MRKNSIDKMNNYVNNINDVMNFNKIKEYFYSKCSYIL